MLKIHHNFIPHLSERSRSLGVMRLSAVEADNDELIRAIEEERARGSWENDSNDAESLTTFWEGVEEDIKNDPEWITFADDDAEEE